jgi:hypothetical protein
MSQFVQYANDSIIKIVKELTRYDHIYDDGDDDDWNINPDDYYSLYINNAVLIEKEYVHLREYHIYSYNVIRIFYEAYDTIDKLVRQICLKTILQKGRPRFWNVNEYLTLNNMSYDEKIICFMWSNIHRLNKLKEYDNIVYCLLIFERYIDNLTKEKSPINQTLNRKIWKTLFEHCYHHNCYTTFQINADIKPEYDKMKKQYRPFLEELCKKVYHPTRMQRIADLYYDGDVMRCDEMTI